MMKGVFPAWGFLFVGVVVLGYCSFNVRFVPGLTTGLAAEELTPIQRGRGKAQMCTRCHGRLGMARAAKASEWKGSVEAFVVVGLSQFRDGSRVHAVMNAVAGPLSDLDIQDVAAWYEKVSGFKDQQ